MNFNQLNRYRLIDEFRFLFLDKLLVSIGVLLLLFMTSLGAQVPVNVNEKNEQWHKDVPFTNQRMDKDVPTTNQSTSKPVLPAQKANTEPKYYTLYAETWEIARSGESMLFFPVLNQIINVWLEDRQKKIEIQYPGGEEGELWVHELTDWLVSLGIPSDHLVIIAGSGTDDVINFALIK